MENSRKCAQLIRRMLAAVLVAVTLLCALPGDALAATIFKAKVKDEYCNVYKSPDTKSQLLRKAPQNSVMTVGAVKGDWCYVKFDGTIGYALKSKLTTDLDSTTEPAPETTPVPETTPAPAPETTPAPEQNEENKQESSSSNGLSVITTKATKLYKKASTAAASYGTIPKGKKLVCTKVSGSWARVEAAGKVGYVLKSSLKSAGSSSGSSSGSAATTPDDSSSSSSSSSANAKMICYMKQEGKLCSSASTSASASAELAKGDKVLVAQVKNGWAKVYNTAGTLGYVQSSLLSKTKVSPARKVVLKDWFESDIQDIFDRGTYAKVVDVITGKSFNIRRKGGVYHADVETVSTSDTKTMLAVYGGKWSWDRRAIWVVIDGVYYAASMNGMSHGEETSLSNNMEGHFCIHFLNSRTHGTNMDGSVCPLHQACVKQAYYAQP